MGLRRLPWRYLGALVVVAVVFSPSSAFADPVEVVDESDGSHCTAPTVTNHVPAGECHAEMYGEHIDRAGHVLGVEVTNLLVACEYSYDIYFGEDGSGYVTGMSVVQGPEPGSTAACNNIRSCNSETMGETHPGTEGGAAGQHAWPLTTERTGTNPDGFVMTMTVCFRTGQVFLPECEGELHLPVVEINEDLFEVTAHDATFPEGAGTFATKCEITGMWNVTEEEGDDFHIN